MALGIKKGGWAMMIYLQKNITNEQVAGALKRFVLQFNSDLEDFTLDRLHDHLWRLFNVQINQELLFFPYNRVQGENKLYDDWYVVLVNKREKNPMVFSLHKELMELYAHVES